MDIQKAIRKNLVEDDPLVILGTGRRYPFTESPRKHVGKEVRSGVYTIWRGQELVYAGFAGKDGAKSGFVGRLVQHRIGDRSGDKFCVYVFDHYVLPRLTPDRVQAADDGRPDESGV